MSDLKPGDRALIALPRPCCGSTDRLGMTVVVLDSMSADRAALAHNKLFSFCGKCHKSYDGLVANVGGGVWIQVARLVPLPPDDEAKRLFRETERPVTA
jgi:hypothetical protein